MAATDAGEYRRGLSPAVTPVCFPPLGGAAVQQADPDRGRTTAVHDRWEFGESPFGVASDAAPIHLALRGVALAPHDVTADVIAAVGGAALRTRNERAAA